MLDLDKRVSSNPNLPRNLPNLHPILSPSHFDQFENTLSPVFLLSIPWPDKESAGYGRKVKDQDKCTESSWDRRCNDPLPGGLFEITLRRVIPRDRALLYCQKKRYWITIREAN